MAKNTVSRIILLVIAAILIIALIVATVLVSIKPKAEYKGVLTPDDVIKEEIVIYSLETENQFRRNVGTFLENMISAFFNRVQGMEGTEIPITNSSLIATPLLEIFQNSAIPSSKLNNFGNYIASLDADSAVVSMWFFFIAIEENPDGTYSGRFKTSEELAISFTKDIDFLSGINDFIQNTALTAEETGRLLYELINTFALEEQREILTSIGRKDLVNLFVSVTTIYEAYVQFSLVGGTLRDARMIGELAYELGASIDGIINDIGVKNLLLAVNLSKDGAVDNTALKEFLISVGVDTATLADMDEVDKALSAGLELAEFVIYFMRTTLMEVGNSPFEHLALYYANEKENIDNYMYMYELSLSRAIKKGLDDGFSRDSNIKTREDLVKALAKFKLTSEDVSGDILDPAKRQAELEEYFNEYLGHVIALAENFESVEKVEDILSLSDADRALLKEHSDFLNDFNYNELTVGTEDLASTIIINVAFNLFKEVTEEAIGSVN